LNIPKGVCCSSSRYHPCWRVCFVGFKTKCPTKTKKIKGKDFSRISIYILLFVALKWQRRSETNITVVGDYKKPYQNDFIADEKVMEKLFEYVLDRHSNFMPSESKDVPSETEEEPLKAQPKKLNKIPKAHVCTIKK